MVRLAQTPCLRASTDHHSDAFTKSETGRYFLSFYSMTSPPWNRGRYVGARLAFTACQAKALAKHLHKKQAWHDYCLFVVAIDTMLRSSDLLRLRVSDLTHASGAVREMLLCRQRKTDKGVSVLLTHRARVACATWIAASEKHPDQYLFTRGKPNGADPISQGFYRQLVKEWAKGIGLDPESYSSHSCRRTKPVHLYRCGVAIEDIAQLLGHRSTTSTIYYLGLKVEKAQNEARRHDVFANGKATQSDNTSVADRTCLSDLTIDRIAARVAARLGSCCPPQED